MPLPDDDAVCVCHCEARHHAKLNQHRLGKCWGCYPDCYEFRQHEDIVKGKYVAVQAEDERIVAPETVETS